MADPLDGGHPPQLAAPGVEAKVIRRKTGWQVIWGQFMPRIFQPCFDISQTGYSLLFSSLDGFLTPSVVFLTHHCPVIDYTQAKYYKFSSWK